MNAPPPKGSLLDDLLPLTLGIGITGPAVLLAFMFIGPCHGSDSGAKILFPFASVLRGGLFSLLLGLIQFPAYGAILSFMFERRHWTAAGIGLALVHAAAVVFCFWATGS